MHVVDNQYFMFVCFRKNHLLANVLLQNNSNEKFINNKLYCSLGDRRVCNKYNI